MDHSVTDELSPRARRYGLLVTALAPVIPQVLGSAFNIWYNAIVIAPLLVTEELRHRFATTVIFYNAAVYPLAIWIYLILSLRRIYRELIKGNSVAPQELDQAQRRVIHCHGLLLPFRALRGLAAFPRLFLH